MNAAKLRIAESIKQSIEERRQITVDLSEASQLTGSGNAKGGRTLFDDAFAALRYANPFRMNARVIKKTVGSLAQFVAKKGDALDATNPWLYALSVDTGNTDTAYWQLPVRALTAQLPIRTAALDDIEGLMDTLLEDLSLEFGKQEALSMAINNDQSGTTTTTTGGVDGLRGLDTYADDTATHLSAYGSSGNAITNGLHTIAAFSDPQTGGYVNFSQMMQYLPAQYQNSPNLAWHIHPNVIQAFQVVADGAGGLPAVQMSEGSWGRAIAGIPVIPNGYLSTASTKHSVYLADWSRFLTIVDVEEIKVQAFEQTKPGYTTLLVEKRMACSVRDPFAGVRIRNV
ncbi:major_cap_HK97, phage major capsid protein, HK97 family [uncultured Caudovirales phage]|uniref:Major_cap_HK97, phage major capsid protein, HK97 family n=1 Tax=uncultured Caudovirales phage TaxID=2100421 RepID=A0A6J5TB25_9CAUD|nr:major_cap_HK97, phage major capsid protein, HK97 family [uncultured Caudovirales phage]